MPKALEEKINSILASYSKTKKFKNSLVELVFEKLNKWRLLSRNLFEKLLEEHKKHFLPAHSGKERLTFNNEFEYFSKTPGEYLLLAKDFLSIFTKTKIPIFIEDFPIFVQLKSVPVFWINGGIITLWNFYFKIDKISTTFKEVLQVSNKIVIFPSLEFAHLNFIQTYSSEPSCTLSFSSLEQENPQILEFLKRYLTKNFWIIPDTDIKNVNPFCFIFLKDNTLLPCTPFRVVFKVIESYDIKTIDLLQTKIECLRIRIFYLNSAGEIRKDYVYFPTKLANIIVEKGKIYNGLFFSFIDLDKEWIYPILFSLYEEDLHSYEIFQELLLLFFKKRYLESENLFSIKFEEDEFWNEIRRIMINLLQVKMLPFEKDIFTRLTGKEMLKLLFSALYPVLINSQDKIFFVPPPVGLLNLGKEKLEKFMEWYDSESLNLNAFSFIKISDIIKSFPSYLQLARDLKSKSIYISYLKEIVREMRREDQ
jgi:hypothetical protein